VAKKQGRKPVKKAKPARAARRKPAKPKAARSTTRAAEPGPTPPAEDPSLSPVQQALARRRAALVARLAG
jgi:hypothetical protein